MRRALRSTALALVLTGACAPPPPPEVPDGRRAREWVPLAARFAGRAWTARDGGPTGAGPSIWSADRVRIASEGMQLSVRRDDRGWVAAEVATGLPPPPLTVRARVSGLRGLDPDLVASVFVCRSDRSEADFEVSRWGDPSAPNAQWVVAPALPERVRRFELPDDEVEVMIRWRREHVAFGLGDGRFGWRGPPLLGGAHRLHVNLWSRTGGAREGHAIVLRSLTIERGAELHPDGGSRHHPRAIDPNPHAGGHP